MATNASRLKIVEPETFVTIRKGKTSKIIKNGFLADAIPRAYNLYREVKAVEPGLKELKENIFGEIEGMLDGSGTITCMVNEIGCKVVCGFDYSIDDSDIDQLRAALGDRFDDLVKTTVSYKPERKLVEMCCEADTDDAIRSCIRIKSKTPAFSFIKE